MSAAATNGTPQAIRRGEYAFIEDGATYLGYVKGVDGLFPDVRFTYRPAMPEERAAAMAKLQTAKDSAQAERFMAAELKRRIHSWDLQDRAGGLRPLNETNILKQEPVLFNRLTTIVIYGTDPGDVDPKWAPDQVEEFDETLAFSACAAPKPIADVAAEAALKN